LWEASRSSTTPSPVRYALFLSEVSSVPGIELSGKIPGNYYGGGLRFLRGNIGTNFLVEAAFKFFDINTDEDIRLNRLSFAFGVRL
jgi:hypothetical protein